MGGGASGLLARPPCVCNARSKAASALAGSPAGTQAPVCQKSVTLPGFAISCFVREAAISHTGLAQPCMQQHGQASPQPVSSIRVAPLIQMRPCAAGGVQHRPPAAWRASRALSLWLEGSLDMLLVRLAALPTGKTPAGSWAGVSLLLASMPMGG